MNSILVGMVPLSINDILTSDDHSTLPSVAAVFLSICLVTYVLASFGWNDPSLEPPGLPSSGGVTVPLLETLSMEEGSSSLVW